MPTGEWLVGLRGPCLLSVTAAPELVLLAPPCRQRFLQSPQHLLLLCSETGEARGWAWREAWVSSHDRGNALPSPRPSLKSQPPSWAAPGVPSSLEQ